MTETTATSINSQTFRQIVGNLASGVTVVTTTVNGRDAGMTASSVTSLSLEPPTMLACLNKSVPSAQAVAERGAYVVNVLGEGRGELAKQFASPSSDKFAGCTVNRTTMGLPALDDAIAYLECRVTRAIDAGTHTIFFGEVVDGHIRGGRPLTYFQGGFGRFEFAHNDEVYAALRGLILTGEVWPNEILEVSETASRHEIDESAVFYAFTRLASEGLLVRSSERGYVVRPFNEQISHEAFDARLMLQGEALRVARGRPTQDRPNLEAMHRAFDLMTRSMGDSRFIDFASYVEGNLDFHKQVVALGGSATAVRLYDSLNLRAVLLRSFGAVNETSSEFVAIQKRALEAIAAGNYRLSYQLLEDYRHMASNRVTEILRMKDGVI